MTKDLDVFWMQQAIQLAKKGQFTTHPNPNVGCLILDRAGQLVGQGWHQKAGGPHAEVFALKEAGTAARGGTAYVTLEPCSHYGRTPPCAEALIEAGVARVVVAQMDPNPQVAGRGIQALKQAGLAVRVGVEAKSAEALNPGFLHWCRTGLPWVQVKLAASLDGRTALKNGLSQWITGPAARIDVHCSRAKAGAILSGADTVLKDNPQLNVRLDPALYGTVFSPDNPIRQPVRVIIDTLGRVPANARIFEDKVPVFLVRTRALPIQYPTHVETLLVPDKQGKADLAALIAQLGKKGIHTLWVEAGFQLAGALVQQQLMNELQLYIGPKLMGPDAHPLLDLPFYETMAELPEFYLSQVKQIEQDVKLIYQMGDPVKYISQSS